MHWESVMRKGWVIAAVLGAAATGAAQAAEVEMFGIHTPFLGRYAIYARISNSASVDGGTVSGLSSIGVDILNQTLPAGSATVQTAFNALPAGTTKYNDDLFTPPSVGYGFWLVRSDGSPFNNTGTGESGIAGISGAQNALITPPGPGDPVIPYANFVLTGVGQAAGEVAADPPGGDKTSATRWTFPVLIATGTYTPSATTGPGSQVGLKFRYFGDSGVNVLKVDNPGAGTPWKIEGVPNPKLADARNFTLGTNATLDTTVKAGLGDADLDGQVNFNDLVRLAQNYNQSNKTWFQGDFNYDGQVDFNDLVALAQNYNSPVPSDPVFGESFNGDVARAFATVPEPASSVLMAGVAVGMFARRRRK